MSLRVSSSLWTGRDWRSRKDPTAAYPEVFRDRARGDEIVVGKLTKRRFNLMRMELVESMMRLPYVHSPRDFLRDVLTAVLEAEDPEREFLKYSRPRRPEKAALARERG